MLACHIFGHRYRFSAEGTVLSWHCQRGCKAGGTKNYTSTAAAARYARVFDREDSADIGRRAPLIALFPLRVWYRIRGHRG
ncbi:MAG: hypothetical protein ABI345_07655 [Jatrophihabitans sp.]